MKRTPKSMVGNNQGTLPLLSGAASPALSGAVLRGDALDFAERLGSVPEYANRPFDLVYLDPPFNVGGGFSARRSPETDLARKEGGRRVRKGDDVAFDDAWGGLDGFLAMLRPRLASLRDGMSGRATLWLHLDHRAVHDAKVLCDHVFGRGAFRGEIIWAPGNGARGFGIPSTHQTLLVYTKSADETERYVWNLRDPVLREPFADTSLAMHFKNVDDDGRRYRERVINEKAYRYYEDEGRQRGSVWMDLPAMVANTPLRKEGTGYPTQKPIGLLDRIVRAASLPGSLVVDPMCGSGTTLVAAALAGRAFAGGDKGDLALSITRNRLLEASIPFFDGT